MDNLLLGGAFGCYLVVCLGHFAFHERRRPWAALALKYGAFVGFLCLTGAVMFRIFSQTQLSFIAHREKLIFFIWAFVLVYSVLQHRYRVRVIASFVVPLICLFLAYALFLPEMPGRADAVGLGNLWLALHVIFSLLGNLAFAIIFVVGVVYLVQERQLKNKRVGLLFRWLPSLGTLDQIGYRSLILGFPFFTMGMISGAVRAHYVWGSFWNWADPIELWSLIAWLIYAVMLQARLTVGWRGRRAAILSMFGFAAVVLTFVSLYMFMEPFHRAS